jgi:NADPH2:quinone reductase
MLGSECDGTVLAVGEGIKGSCTGDHVATIPGFTSVPGFATAMKGHECAVYGEQPYVPADMVVKMPNDMSFIDGVALWTQYSTAWNALLDTAKLQKGEYVLLTAATSSVAILVHRSLNRRGPFQSVRLGVGARLRHSSQLGLSMSSSPANRV